MKIEITVDRIVGASLLRYFNIRYKKNFKLDKLNQLCKLALGEVLKDQCKEELEKIDKEMKEREDAIVNFIRKKP